MKLCIFSSYITFGGGIYMFQLLEYYNAYFILMMEFMVNVLCSNRISWVTCSDRTIFLAVCFHRMEKEHSYRSIMSGLKWRLVLAFRWCVWLVLYVFIYADLVGDRLYSLYGCWWEKELKSIWVCFYSK